QTPPRGQGVGRPQGGGGIRHPGSMSDAEVMAHFQDLKSQGLPNVKMAFESYERDRDEAKLFSNARRIVNHDQKQKQRKHGSNSPGVQNPGLSQGQIQGKVQGQEQGQEQGQGQGQGIGPKGRGKKGRKGSKVGRQWERDKEEGSPPPGEEHFTPLHSPFNDATVTPSTLGSPGFEPGFEGNSTSSSLAGLDGGTPGIAAEAVNSNPTLVTHLESLSMDGAQVYAGRQNAQQQQQHSQHQFHQQNQNQNQHQQRGPEEQQGGGQLYPQQQWQQQQLGGGLSSGFLHQGAQCKNLHELQHENLNQNQNQQTSLPLVSGGVHSSNNSEVMGGWSPFAVTPLSPSHNRGTTQPGGGNPAGWGGGGTTESFPLHDSFGESGSGVNQVV
ncbi:unnamed protein product, partial [Choristocarpus tenellus]